jgi:hypothetical protein
MSDKASPVTERDFRRPEFLDAKPEDYERRADGRVVRKDRWEVTVRAIASHFGVDPREGFECDTLLFWVEEFIDRAKDAGVNPCYDEELPQ